MVLDRFAPPTRPKADSIWIQPPASGSPVPVRATQDRNEDRTLANRFAAGRRVCAPRICSWNRPKFSSPASGDIAVAESSEGPLIVARASSPKIVVIGFEPLAASMKYELSTPLLIANILRWMAPETFRRMEAQAGSVGTVNVPVDAGTDPANVNVITEDQTDAALYHRRKRLCDSSTARRERFACCTGDRETVYSLTLPDLGEAVWRAPQNVRRGIPRASASEASVTDFWPWLALLGGLGLLADWLLFGRSRAFRLRAGRTLRARIANRRGEKPHDVRSHVGAGHRLGAAGLDGFRMAPDVETLRAGAESAVAGRHPVRAGRAAPQRFGNQSRGRGAGGYFRQRLFHRSGSCFATSPISIASERGRHWMRVIPFARSTRSLDRAESQKPWHLLPTAGEAGRATDLEAAIREAAATLPAGLVPRIALISDGRQNKGSVARAAWQAQAVGHPYRYLRHEGTARSRRCIWNPSACRRSRSRANSFPSTSWFPRPKPDRRKSS